MRISILLLAAIAVLAPSLSLTTNAATGPCGMNAAPQAYDLNADWSTTQNPNGTWSYREGESLLISNPSPWVGADYHCTLASCALFSATALEKIAGGPRAYGPWMYGFFGENQNLQEGDVVFVPGAGGNIRWTAPTNGTIDIAGIIWWAYDYVCSDGGIATSWTLTHNGSVLSGGDVHYPPCGGNSRDHPHPFSAGSGGAAALQNISVVAGDQIVLTANRGEPIFGSEPLGVNLTITLTPEGSVNTFFADDAIIWHQPLARSGASEDTDPSAGRTVKYRFKRGSTIPIQIHALGCDGGDVTSNANVIGKVTVFGDSNCDAAADGNETAIDFNGVGGGGGVMDKMDGHLKYNLDTKSLPASTQCYILRVTVTDTSTGEEKFEEVLLQAK